MIVGPDSQGKESIAMKPKDLCYSNTKRTDVIDIPVIGRIAAGTPILAEQNVEDTFPIPARFAGKGTTFMLTVSGESMIEAGIFDGDYILVEQQNTANNGDIVVAMIDGFESEATVKTFYREADHIRLQPENSSMSPIRVTDVKILGKVKGVFRYF
jgi:repressor LexA